MLFAVQPFLECARRRLAQEHLCELAPLRGVQDVALLQELLDHASLLCALQLGYRGPFAFDALPIRLLEHDFHAAAREPKQVVWFDGGHRELPGRGAKAMWTFLRRHLETPATLA